MIRPATAADQGAIALVATAHGIDGRDSVQNPRYQALLRAKGRLVVADEGGVAGFGGMIVVHGAAMITDLFVLESHHGLGLGTTMTTALVDGYERRMTFSSPHPAARASYVRAGMQPQWTLRYLRGPTTSVSGSSAAGTPARGATVQAVVVPSSDVESDRPELVEFFAWGEVVRLEQEGSTIGFAIVTDADAGPHFEIVRLATSASHAASMAAVLHLLHSRDPSREVQACVPSVSSAAGFLEELGFVDVESDLHLSSEPGLLASTLAAVNPGLA